MESCVQCDKSVKAFALSSVCIRYQLLYIVAYSTWILALCRFRFHLTFPFTTAVITLRLPFNSIVKRNAPLLWSTPQHLCCSSSINQLNVDDSFSLNFVDSVKNKRQTIDGNIGTHSTLHCFVLLSLILLMTLSMNYFAVRSFSLYLYLSLLAIQCSAVSNYAIQWFIKTISWRSLLLFSISLSLSLAHTYNRVGQKSTGIFSVFFYIFLLKKCISSA